MASNLPVEKERRYLVSPHRPLEDIIVIQSYDIAQFYLKPPSREIAYLFSQEAGGAVTLALASDDSITIHIPAERTGTLPYLFGSAYLDSNTGALDLPDHSVVRARTKKTPDGLIGEFAIKVYEAGQVLEFEAGISVDEANHLIKAAGKTGLHKRRCEIMHAGYLVELDMFQGPLNGLIIAEVEQKDGGPDIDRFYGPHWFGPEITGLKEFSNAALADKGQPKALYDSLMNPAAFMPNGLIIQ